MKMINMKTVLVLLIVLSARKFLNPFGLFDNEQIAKVLYYGLSMVGFVYALTLRKSPGVFQGFPSIAYALVFSGMLISVFMASVFYEQSLYLSFISVLPYFVGYLFLYILMKLQLREEQVLIIIGVLVGLSVFAYFVNYATFPYQVFDTRGYVTEIKDNRGVLRIGVPYVQMFVFMVLYAVNRWIVDKNIKWVVLSLGIAVMIVLSLTRQVIVLAFLLSAWFMMRRLSWIRKAFVVFVAVGFMTVVLPQIPVFTALVEKTQSDVAGNVPGKENPRIRAIRYYADENQANVLTRVFGNGVPSIGKSMWGNKFAYDVYSIGCYASDVGWVGFYWYFGIFSASGVFVLFFKGYVRKKETRDEYLSYFCVAIILLSIASGPILVYTQLPSLMLPLYLIYGTPERRGGVRFVRQEGRVRA